MALVASRSDHCYSRVLAKNAKILQADSESRNHKYSSNWRLNPHIFSQIVNIRRVLQIDLFASRLNNQLLKYMVWHPDPGSFVYWTPFNTRGGTFTVMRSLHFA